MEANKKISPAGRKKIAAATKKVSRKPKRYTGEEAMPASVALTPAQFRRFGNRLLRDFEMQLEQNHVKHTAYYVALLSTSLSNATSATKALAPFFPAAFAIEEGWSDIAHAT